MCETNKGHRKKYFKQYLKKVFHKIKLNIKN